jgi:hypothetical protein
MRVSAFLSSGSAKADAPANRRRSERRACRGLAKIQFGIGSLPRDCTIVDVSEGGIRLIAENLDVPDEFTILLAEGRRQCRLAWRIGCEFGAQFIDEKRSFAA